MWISVQRQQLVRSWLGWLWKATDGTWFCFVVMVEVEIFRNLSTTSEHTYSILCRRQIKSLMLSQNLVGWTNNLARYCQEMVSFTWRFHLVAYFVTYFVLIYLKNAVLLNYLKESLKNYISYHKNIKQLFFNFANNKMFLEQKISTLEWFQNDNLTVKTGVMTAENCCAKFFQISVCFVFFVLQLCRRPECGRRWQEERRSQHFLSGLWTFIWALPEVGPPHVWTRPCQCHHQLLMYFYFPFFPL